jgi:prolyl oligopeptidase
MWGVAVLFGLAVAVPAVAQEEPDSRPGAVEQLHALFESEWQRNLRENPIYASYFGEREYNDQLPDRSIEAIRASHEADKAALDKLESIDRDELPADEQLNYDLFRVDLEDDIEGFQYQGWLMPLNQRGGIQTFDETQDRIRMTTEKDYRDWVARLEAFGTYTDQTIALMKKGIEEGMVMPKVVMERIPDQITRHVVEDPKDSPFHGPFEERPEAIDESAWSEIREKGLAAIEDVVVPAYDRFETFFNETYLPASRESVGAWDLPEGRSYYEYLARSFTTTNMTPEEIHEIGKREVKRIRAEMDKVIEEVGFEGTFDEFLHHLRTDPKFYYEDPEELLEAYKAISKDLDPQLVKLFGRLPRMPYGVKPIPEAVAPDTTTAYYMRPAGDGSRAGYYYVNLYEPETRPKYEMDVLSVHEAVPGHHLQIALAQELEGLPKFRRYGGETAFVEGWGLYSESLCQELGACDDPYSHFGQLTYDMWRAVRLVVDTGMHYMKWSREEAIDYFKKNAAKSEADIVNEIDRYIAWPGQALAYKIGQLRIMDLKAEAKKELGKDFDIKAFHDTVLGNGAVPLNVLERIVRDWIEEQKAEA